VGTRLTPPLLTAKVFAATVENLAKELSMQPKKYLLKPFTVDAVEVMQHNLDEAITTILLDSGERPVRVPCLVDDERVEDLWLTKRNSSRLLGYYITKDETGRWYAIAKKLFLDRYEPVAADDELVTLQSYVNFSGDALDINPLGNLDIKVTKGTIENLNKFLQGVTIYGSHYVGSIKPLEGKLTYHIKDIEEGTDYSSLPLSEVWVTPTGAQLHWRYAPKTVIVGFIKGNTRLTLNV
jgi:hypothetical protein